MAGGMKITDKGGWPGDAEELMRSSNRIKTYSSADGAGELTEYWDTTEKIKEKQDMGQKKIKSNSPKSGYGN